MKIFLGSLPYILSFVLGYLGIGILLNKERSKDGLVNFFLAIGLGLGMSAYVLFYQILLGDVFQKTIVLVLHLILIAFFGYQLWTLNKEIFRWDLAKAAPQTLLILLPLGLALIPVWIMASFYPEGGWDAWSVWNLKSKFIFSGVEYWKNIFDPSLWRSSPHYPLLLPLINVWGWVFQETPSLQTPLGTSILFTFMTAGLLLAGLKHFTKSYSPLIASLAVLTLPFFVKLATSQYCDIVFAYYLLAAVYCFITGYHEKSRRTMLLSGVFLGFLSFSKNEGSIASLLLILLAMFFLLRLERTHRQTRQSQLIHFLFGAALFAVPSVIFEFFYSPGNQTFINGLSSLESPSTWERMRMILMFLAVEFKSGKWNGMWILLGIGLLLSKGRCFKKPASIIPLFLILYLSIVCFYYFLNTYFEITWWMTVTLGRLAFALLPTVIFWVFSSLWQDKLPQKH